MYGTTTVQVGDKEIDFKAPFKRISIYDAIKEHTGFDVSNMDEEQLARGLQATAHSCR